MAKIIYFLLKYNWLWKLIPLAILLSACILFPDWVKSGTFEGSYIMTTLTAIACYGGFIGWLVLLIKNK